MTISELHSDEELRKNEFPVVARYAYFAHAGVSPLPRRVGEAIAAHASACQYTDQEEAISEQLVRQTRALAATLLGVQADEISFIGPTSAALSLVANGLPFKPGDNILIYPDDYPSNVYPWMQLARRGVEIRRLRVRELGLIEPEEVIKQLDSRTKLVALASCHFVSGWQIDHVAIGRVLRERNVWFCLDAIQTLGATPVFGQYVDFVAADAHKWLLGPCGAGILYVRKEMQDVLEPTLLGWNNVFCPNFVACDQVVWQHGPRRYESGTLNLLGIAGMRAAFELLLEIGIETIAAQLRNQRQLLIHALLERKCNVLHPDAPQANSAGILSFYKPGVDSRAIHRRLTERNIITSLRADRSGRFYVRVSPHFYNTEAELYRLLEEL